MVEEYLLYLVISECNDPGLCYTCRGVSGLKMGHSLENLHRVGSHGTTDYRFVALGEHGTSVCLYWLLDNVSPDSNKKLDFGVCQEFKKFYIGILGKVSKV